MAHKQQGTIDFQEIMNTNKTDWTWIWRMIACLMTSGLAIAAPRKEDNGNQIPLAGTWSIKLDREDRGIKDAWFRKELAKNKIQLPGSLQAQGYGDVPGTNTAWTGQIVDRSYFTDPKYAPYRQTGNVKVPFWLTPERHYVGAAWYQREVKIPGNWKGKRILLQLERAHWETTVWVDDQRAGSSDSLSTPHEYDLSALLGPGTHRLTIRVDNRLKVDVGSNAHSVSDHTQSNWNGLTGQLRLIAMEPVAMDDIQVFPDLANKLARLRVVIRNITSHPVSAEVVIQSRAFNTQEAVEPPSKFVPLNLPPGWSTNEFEWPLGDKVLAWDEFSPALYRLNATLQARIGKTTLRDVRTVVFGVRDFHAEGNQLVLNGRKVFLRGTLECAIFPRTGYPPTDTEAWKKVLRACRAHGLNHIRFHSWCPPEAAFVAADEMGFYLYAECASWTAVGDGKPVDRWIEAEGDRILKAYGNHPSLVMMSYGNEPGGSKQNTYLGRLVNSWKQKDPRRLYTSAAGWPMLPENDFHVTPTPRVQQWGQGLGSRINARPPETFTDYRDFVAGSKAPVISHEIGQWCVYPNLEETNKYTGVLKAKNFEIFRDGLKANHLLDQARSLLMASGKLQVLCYKEEIESALRTPGFGGFELLDLHDFPGQGTALVGILDPFWESKGYVSAGEFSRFACETVPLARMRKRILTQEENFAAQVELAHYGPTKLENLRPGWRIKDSTGQVVASGQFPQSTAATGELTLLGRVNFPLNGIRKAGKFNLEVALEGTPFANDWDFWVYPSAGTPPPQAPEIVVTAKLDEAVLAALSAGQKVLLLPPVASIKGDASGRIPAGFSSIFWNTAWTRRQAPHTLGILCDPKHAALADFPTEAHSNWQWWELVTQSHPFILNGLPADLRPIVQVIDDWFTNRRLGLVFEAQVNGGRLLACGIDLETNLGERPVARQMRASLLKYMSSPGFKPACKLAPKQVQELLGEPAAKASPQGK